MMRRAVPRPRWRPASSPSLRMARSISQPPPYGCVTANLRESSSLVPVCSTPTTTLRVSAVFPVGPYIDGRLLAQARQVAQPAHLRGTLGGFLVRVRATGRLGDQCLDL